MLDDPATRHKRQGAPIRRRLPERV